jgi:hypothetical protein
MRGIREPKFLALIGKILRLCHGSQYQEKKYA